VTKSRRMKKVRHIAQMRDRCANIFLVGKPKGWRPLEDLGLYRSITWKWIFWLKHTIQMTPGEQSGKN
jgi:hypothetical protein